MTGVYRKAEPAVTIASRQGSTMFDAIYEKVGWLFCENAIAIEIWMCGLTIVGF